CSSATDHLHLSDSLSTSPAHGSAPTLLLNPNKKLSHVLPLSNAVQTFFNISKAIVGAGSFALPWCFKNMGLWAASVTLILVAILSIHTILLLIKCKRYLIYIFLFDFNEITPSKLL